MNELLIKSEYVMSKFTNYEFVFDSEIAGIPCQIAVTEFEHVKPWHGSIDSCPSDLDYYGYTTMEWVVLDRKGYFAGWLADKLTDADETRIEHEIKAYIGIVA